jgi:phospholipid:diacylglycerol acyltransferase
MATVLRRRVAHTAHPEKEVKEDLPREDSSLNDTEEKVSRRSSIKRRPNTYIFVLGILFGLVAAGFFARSRDLIEFPELGGVLDALPAYLVKDVRELVVSWRTVLCFCTCEHV